MTFDPKPTPENDKTWPIGMGPDGELNEVDEHGIPIEEPTEENE